ncbi:Zn-ribbon domain-containing OB-fold protein [Chloroflexota bacterium]
MNELKDHVPVAQGLFSWPSEDPRFIATKCKVCGDVFFPSREFCANPNCGNLEVEEILLSKKGKLYSYTIQYYQPPKPFVPADPYVPLGIGLVEFPEGVRICGQIMDCDPEKDLTLNMDVEMVIDALDDKVVAWKFRLVK